jgi:hypothetical protein
MEGGNGLLLFKDNPSLILIHNGADNNDPICEMWSLVTHGSTNHSQTRACGLDLRHSFRTESMNLGVVFQSL